MLRSIFWTDQQKDPRSSLWRCLDAIMTYQIWTLCNESKQHDRVHSVMCATLISSHFCTVLSMFSVVSISSYCHSPLLSQIRSHHAAAQSKPERRREDRKWSVMTFVNASRSFGWKKTAAGSGKTNPVAGLAMTCGVNVKLALRNQELSQHSFAPHVPS